jgi:hypothetical protein
MPAGPLLCRAFARRWPVWPAAEFDPGARQVRSRGKVLVVLGTGRVPMFLHAQNAAVEKDVRPMGA